MPSFVAIRTLPGITPDALAGAGARVKTCVASMCSEGVQVRWVRERDELAGADWVILPGSKNTVTDLAWLRARRLDQAVVTHAAQGGAVLGICGGQQLLHVVLGGKLIQHIPDSVADALAHEQPNPRNEPGHVVKVARGTQLHQIVGADQLDVNSAHHQAAADAPKGVVINATAPDGVIEGIEAPQYRFCIGVQWHPEFLISEGDARLFKAFLGAASAR